MNVVWFLVFVILAILIVLAAYRNGRSIGYTHGYMDHAKQYDNCGWVWIDDSGDEHYCIVNTKEHHTHTCWCD